MDLLTGRIKMQKLKDETLYLLYLHTFPKPHVSFEAWKEWKLKMKGEKE